MSDQDFPHIPNFKEFRCQKPNMCFELKPLVEQHGESIADLYDRTGALTLKVGDLNSKSEERSKVINWIITIGVSLVGISVVNLGVLLIWIGSANAQLAYLKESDTRQSDLLYKIEHQTKP